MALAPLRPFGLRSCLVSTMQAVSGAGYPGVPSLDILGNVIPFISGEEEKIETETRKILGSLVGRVGRAAPRPGERAHEPGAGGGRAHRDGLGRPRAEALASRSCARPSRASRAPRSGWGCPSRRSGRSLYLDQPNRPQPRFDAGRGRGMTVSVGRLRPCPVLDWKFVALGHNTVRGAAGAAVLNAELLQAEGLLD